MKSLIPNFFRRERNDLTQSIVGKALGSSAASPFLQYQVLSLVSESMTINGDIRSEAGAALDGTVNGSVEVAHANAALLVRASARINGNVSAPQVLVSGEVHGDIDARFVRLYPGSRVYGKISAARMIVDDGAIISNDSIGVIEHKVRQERPVLDLVPKVERRETAAHALAAVPEFDAQHRVTAAHALASVPELDPQQRVQDMLQAVTTRGGVLAAARG